MRPAPELVDRFRSDLDALVEPDERVGVAVSGGPDSMALLLLAAAARPGFVEAATVDHALRPESCGEAEMVAAMCERLRVPHAILTAEWAEPPATALQERARAERYRLLARWAAERNLAAVATAHHLDDQAETLVMRLARGAGVRGLAGMRASARVPGSDVPLIRPLLSWRRSELEQLCLAAGVQAVADPSNTDEQFERVRIRRALAEAEWLNSESLAASAAHLAEADAALNWTSDQEWRRAVTANGTEIVYRPDSAPPEIRRRIVTRALAALATEGDGADLRGRELDRLIAELESGRQTTLRGVLCSGGEEWRFVPAPHRAQR
ncbi:MAG TPA: tRNA lysidine(34) synthetase TilS [Sphingomicrobium sp.]